METLIVTMAVALPVIGVCGVWYFALRYRAERKAELNELEKANQDKQELVEVLKKLVDVKAEVISRQRGMLGF